MTAQIQTTAGQLHFVPGELISGTVTWPPAPGYQTAHLRLLWFTSGKGDRDIGIVDELPLDSPASGGTRSFQFTAPAHPPSFSARLISLEWALELAVAPNGPIESTTITIGPEGRELDLSRLLPDDVSQPEKAMLRKAKNFFGKSTGRST